MRAASTVNEEAPGIGFAMPSLRRPPGHLDPVLVAAAVLLVVVGLVLSLATTSELAKSNELGLYYYTIRQCAYAGLALATMLAVSRLTERSLRRLGVLLFAVMLVATALLPVFGTDYGKGSHRWYSLGFFSLQPSEFIKTGLAITLAWFLAGETERDGPPGSVIAAGLAILVAGMLILQPDFGQAFLVLGIWAVMYFLAGASPATLLAIGVGGTLVPLLAFFLSSHAASRIGQFLQGTPERYSQGQFVAEAIGNAGWFGNGVNDGRVSAYLPEAHSDFIIAAAADEYGLLACAAIFLLYAAIGLRVTWGLRGAGRSLFVRLACIGVTVQLLLQALVHYGVNLRVLPAKGIALPLVSYGGSSMLAAGLAMGVLLALTRRRKAPMAGGETGRAGS